MNILFYLFIIFLICSALALLYLYLIMPALGQKGDVSSLRNYYYAHRGLHDEQTPENSMAAFRAAALAGYGIELDVQLTKDKVPVVFHDFTLDRVCGVTGRVRDFTYEELQAFSLENTDERIPRFADVLRLVNGQVPLLIEYKVEYVNTAVCGICDALLQTYPGLYFIESFNPLVLRWYKKHRPQVVRGQLSAKFREVHAFYHYFYLSPLHHLLFNFLTKPDFISYDYTCAGALSRRLCKNLYKNLSVAWTIRSREDMERLKRQFDLFIFEGFRPLTAQRKKDNIQTLKNRRH